MRVSQERLKPHEWAAAAVAFVGVLGLGASSEPSHLEHPEAGVGHILCTFMALSGLLGESRTAGGGKLLYELRIQAAACTHCGAGSEMVRSVLCLPSLAHTVY